MSTEARTSLMLWFLQATQLHLMVAMLNHLMVALLFKAKLPVCMS